VLGAAGLVHQAADLLILAFPEPAYAAMVAVLVLEPRVDVSNLVERCHEFVAAVPGAQWKLLRSGELKLNALEYVGKCHGEFLRL
jgi:hypothetical protein